MKARYLMRSLSGSVVAFVKRHKIFKGVFPYSYDVLHSVVTVVGHVSALQLRRFQRFASYGPWPHHY